MIVVITWVMATSRSYWMLTALMTLLMRLSTGEFGGAEGRRGRRAGGRIALAAGAPDSPGQSGRLPHAQHVVGAAESAVLHHIVVVVEDVLVAPGAGPGDAIADRLQPVTRPIRQPDRGVQAIVKERGRHHRARQADRLAAIGGLRPGRRGDQRSIGLLDEDLVVAAAHRVRFETQERRLAFDGHEGEQAAGARGVQVDGDHLAALQTEGLVDPFAQRPLLAEGPRKRRERQGERGNKAAAATGSKDREASEGV